MTNLCAPLLYGRGSRRYPALPGISSEDRKKYQAVMTKFDIFLRSEKMLFLSVPASIIEDKERANQLNSLLQVYITLQKAANMVSSKKR